MHPACCPVYNKQTQNASRSWSLISIQLHRACAFCFPSLFFFFFLLFLLLFLSFSFSFPFFFPFQSSQIAVKTENPTWRGGGFAWKFISHLHCNHLHWPWWVGRSWRFPLYTACCMAFCMRVVCMQTSAASSSADSANTVSISVTTASPSCFPPPPAS